MCVGWWMSVTGKLRVQRKTGEPNPLQGPIIEAWERVQSRGIPSPDFDSLKSLGCIDDRRDGVKTVTTVVLMQACLTFAANVSTHCQEHVGSSLNVW